MVQCVLYMGAGRGKDKGVQVQSISRKEEFTLKTFVRYADEKEEDYDLDCTELGIVVGTRDEGIGVLFCDVRGNCNPTLGCLPEHLKIVEGGDPALMRFLLDLYPDYKEDYDLDP